MEYFQYDDFTKFIFNSDQCTESGAKMITMHLLEGLNIMYKMGFTHRDLKPQVGYIEILSRSKAVFLTRKSDIIAVRIFSSFNALLGGEKRSATSVLRNVSFKQMIRLP